MAPKMNYTKEMRDRNKAFMKAFRDEGHLVGVHIVGARVRDMVTDDFGTTTGLITLEDAIETLLGVEIVDEHDHVIDMRKLAKAKLKQQNLTK